MWLRVELIMLTFGKISCTMFFANIPTRYLANLCRILSMNFSRTPRFKIGDDFTMIICTSMIHLSSMFKRKLTRLIFFFSFTTFIGRLSWIMCLVKKRSNLDVFTYVKHVNFIQGGLCSNHSKLPSQIAAELVGNSVRFGLGLVLKNTLSFSW